jgi:rhodanese-related sulfurtransferase/SHS2 domain-containing protein
MTSRPDFIDTEAAYEYFEDARAQFIDAQPAIAYQRSRECIPGAFHVDPGGGAGRDGALAALPRERLLIAYCCDPTISASAGVARRARELGIGDACFLSGGLEAWKEAGLPTQVAFAAPEPPPPWQDGHHPRYLVAATQTSLRLTVEAANLRELFDQAARALIDQLAVSGPSRAPVERHAITVEAGNVDALLVGWLSEILSHSRQAGRLFSGATIHRITERGLHAELVAEHATSRWRRDLATIAVTDASIDAQPDRQVGQVVVAW